MIKDRLYGLSLVGITLVLLVAVLRLSYKEDIRDFLPLNSTDRERMAVYQDISGMNRLFVIFENPDNVELTTQAIDRFLDPPAPVRGMDPPTPFRGSALGFESLSETMDFLYQNAPLFLTEGDYRRMDSLLAQPEALDERLQEDLDALMLPAGSFLSQNIGRDPLGLFTPIVEELRQSQAGKHFEIYDGYLFTSDMSRAIVMLTSPFGSSETDRNAHLIDQLEEAIAEMQKDFPEVKAHVAGGPQIAVGNARQIVRDSILAVSLSAILILALLLYAFRSVRNILLIALSVVWGWLFALGGLALVHDSVSMIVVGISSIIIGIAVNYPLHLISHVQHQPDVRQALCEIRKPLLVGNITTVGAFLALVPLKSIALRDLGLFASFLLVGTILFVLVWLPRLLRGGDNNSIQHSEPLPLRQSAGKTPSKLGAIVLLLLTLVFGYFSFSVEFDTDLSNINYMTAEQKAEMATLPSTTGSGEVAYYLLSSAAEWDEALRLSESRQGVVDSLKAAGLVQNHQGVGRYLPSKAEQAVRLERWREWVARHPQFMGDLDASAAKHGFAEDAFADFKAIMQSEYKVHPFEYFQPLTSQALAANVSQAGSRHATIAELLTVRQEDAERVKAHLPDAFDIASLNSSVAEALSADFNYIGWVCSLIVFLFLWLSFRRIELAVISFIPMAVSWIWILGIMSLLGIKFNIVNIILATFIFGQGDDYTIFITEGCVSEYEHGKPVLAAYRRSIILSALIMFIGIGTLIFAKHPALHSLAEVTIVGMGSVVLMANLIPPMLFKWGKRIKKLTS